MKGLGRRITKTIRPLKASSVSSDKRAKRNFENGKEVGYTKAIRDVSDALASDENIIPNDTVEGHIMRFVEDLRELLKTLKYVKNA